MAAGAGLRYETPVGPIRFDFGYQLNRIDGLMIDGAEQDAALAHSLQHRPGVLMLESLKSEVKSDVDRSPQERAMLIAES